MYKIFLSLVMLAPLLQVKAQKEKDSISTEVINVVSSYKPTISDAFKSKDVPVIYKGKRQKKELKYSINSTPIRSVFRPNVGTYKTAQKDKVATALPNYVKVGYGNYNTPLLEAFLHRQKKQHEGHLYVYNKTSEGGIKGVQLDNNYLNTKIEGSYKNIQKTYNWHAKIGYHKDMQNWYGIPFEYSNTVLDALDVKQSYNRFIISGAVAFKNNKLKTIKSAFLSISDAFKSRETQFSIAPTFEFVVSDNKILTDIEFSLLNGAFNPESEATELDYDFINLGTSAHYQIAADNYFFSLGAKIRYNAAIENSKNTFKIYPDLKIDYVLVEEIFNIYAGISGDLRQNSYREITRANPFVRPDLDIRVTDNNYTAFAGFKGKLSSRIDYTLKASYARENNKLLFRASPNTTDGNTLLAEKSYAVGNSFLAVYDDIKTFGFFGEINAQLNDDITVGGNIQIDNYTTKNEEEAWNLPPFTASVHALYNFDKWIFKAALFTKGERKDTVIDIMDNLTVVNLEAFADLNLSTTYKFTDKWSGFIALKNVLNSDYETFNNYQVQGFQVLAGAIYSFDF